jgi:hypothetical protein
MPSATAGGKVTSPATSQQGPIRRFARKPSPLVHVNDARKTDRNAQGVASGLEWAPFHTDLDLRDHRDRELVGSRPAVRGHVADRRALEDAQTVTQALPQFGSSLGRQTVEWLGHVDGAANEVAPADAKAQPDRESLNDLDPIEDQSRAPGWE